MAASRVAGPASQPAGRHAGPRSDPAAGGVDRPRGWSRAGQAVVGPLVLLACLFLSAAASIPSLSRALTGPGADIAARAYGLVRLGVGHLPFGLSDVDLLSYHLAVYGLATGSYDRYSGLAAATREAVVVAAMAAVLLTWVMARRVTGVWGAAVAALLVGVAPGLRQLHELVMPANLAVPWLLLAAVLVVGRRVWLVSAGLALVTVAMAVALSPVVVIAVAGGLATAIGLRCSSWRPLWRWGLLAVGAVVLVGALVLVLTVDTAPIAAPPVRTAAATIGALAMIAVAILAAWRTPVLRPMAGAVALPAVLAVADAAERAASLVVAAPMAAVLAGALVQQVVDAAVVNRLSRPWRLVPAVVAAVALTGATTAVGVTAGRQWPQRSAGSEAAAAMAAWIDTNLDPSTKIAVDARTWATLVHAGVPIDRLTIEPEQSLPRSEDGVWLTTHPAEPPGDVLARFGSDAAPLALEYCPSPGTCSPSGGAGSEERARQRLGHALLSNTAMHFSPAARATLQEGRVDPRLLVVLAAVSAQHSLTVASLPLPAGEEQDSLRRSITITAIDGATVGSGDGDVGAVARWLAQQQPPFRPPVVDSSGTVLTIGYYAPSPLGLLEDL